MGYRVFTNTEIKCENKNQFSSISSVTPVHEAFRIKFRKKTFFL